MPIMKKECNYCGKKIEIVGKNSMNGHITGCKKYKEWRDNTFNYDFLYEEYIVKGKSALQIANDNGWDSSTIINKQLRRLNIPIRNIKQSHYMQGYKSKIEKTNLKKYGATNPLSKGTVSYEKRNKTVKEKYGVDNVFQHPLVKEKIKNSGAFKYLFPNYNTNSIPIINDYGKKHGYSFQHAENGGEYFVEKLGYYLDGYDKEKNVVIEIDEKHHFNKDGSLKNKDIIRQKEIEKLLGCNFIRIKYEN
jgi:hypothetical protein